MGEGAGQGGPSSETRDHGADNSTIAMGLMGLRQKQLGPRLLLPAPWEDPSGGNSNLVPCPPEMGQEPGRQQSLQAGRCQQWDRDEGLGSFSRVT